MPRLALSSLFLNVTKAIHGLRTESEQTPMAERLPLRGIAGAAAAVPDSDRTALSELSHALGRVAGEPGDVGSLDWPAAAEVELDVADLVGDVNGEIVLFNDSGARTVGISSERAVVADGRSDPHVTAAGADVTGYRYVTFEDGPTLFVEEGVHLIIHRAGTA